MPEPIEFKKFLSAQVFCMFVCYGYIVLILSFL